jgi:hypothetical protein
MESGLIALIIFNALGLVVTILVLATMSGKEWKKWTFVAVLIWVVIFVAEGLILRG